MSESWSSGSSPEPAARRAAAVVVAGGSGRRFGGERPKQFLELAGRPLLWYAVQAFATHPAVDEVVVALPAADAAAPPAWLLEAGARAVAGGDERGDSVRNGLAALSPGAELVLVHDGARPLVTHDVIDRVLAAVGPGNGAVAALPAADTLKRIDGDGWIEETIERARIWHAQTPQGFPRALIVDAYARARALGLRATDDAALCEALGVPVRVVAGSSRNLKVTHPGDLAIAEALLPRPTS